MAKCDIEDLDIDNMSDKKLERLKKLVDSEYDSRLRDNDYIE